jgi:hypothetical protein
MNLKKLEGGWSWLTPVMLVTQEAEIRRIAVTSQPPVNTLQDPILKKPITKKDWWSYSGGRNQEDRGYKSAPSKHFARPYLEKTHHKKRLVERLKV